MNQSLLTSLLNRGDEVAIIEGRLDLVPASRKVVPDQWLEKHHDQLIFEAITAAKKKAFRFCSHTTGKYHKMAGGLTLQFTDLSTGTDAFSIFNVDLNRARTTSYGVKGSPLPNGQFRPGKRSEFVKFWDRSGLPYPRDFASFHERLGKLKQIIFTGSYSGKEKLDKHSIKPLSLSYDELIQALKVSNSFGKNSGTFRESFGKSSGRNLGKDVDQAQSIQGVQANQSTGLQNYGNKVIREEGIKSTSLQLIDSKPPEEQTVDEWLLDYTKSA